MMGFSAFAIYKLISDAIHNNEFKMLHDILPATSKTRRGYD